MSQGLLLFDIDGVVRDVGSSYRKAIQETVFQFARRRPSSSEIDSLKTEGIWNNDWEASYELLKRSPNITKDSLNIPTFQEVVETFNNFYFGGDPEGKSSRWNGFIRNEKLLVEKSDFDLLDQNNVIWGFVSGAELSSVRFVLEEKLSLDNPPIIAMGDAPEKPNPTGLIQLATLLIKKELGADSPPIAYLGDTIADIYTVQRAKDKIPNQKFFSLAVAPPHLHSKDQEKNRFLYEKNLISAGADKVLPSTKQAIKYSIDFFSSQV